jgi:Polyketide cyclase / dehydrase and lipid transport
MAKIYISCVIEAPVETVWKYIRDFNGLPKWFPGVTDSHIEADQRSGQVGCIRNFGMQGGPRMREQLLALSDHTHCCTYKMLEGPLPVRNYVGTVHLLPVTDGDRTFAEYMVEFDCPREQENELTTSLSRIYQGAFEHLMRHLPATTKAAD